jgi:hypothetical protein
MEHLDELQLDEFVHLVVADHVHGAVPQIAQGLQIPRNVRQTSLPSTVLPPTMPPMTDEVGRVSMPWVLLCDRAMGNRCSEAKLVD